MTHLCKHTIKATFAGELSTTVECK